MNSDLIPVFAALGDPTRMAMVEALSKESLPVQALGGPVPLTQQGLSKHLQGLVEAGLVRQEFQGRQRICHLNRTRLEEAIALLEELKMPVPASMVAGFDAAMD